MTILGNKADIIILDDLEDDLSLLGPDDLEAYQRDPEAYLAWLETVMGGGPQFTLDSFPDPLAMVLQAKPAMDFYPQSDNTGPPTTTKPKWQKERGHGWSKAYFAQEHARKQKRLDKRATTKANRKRARNGRS